VSTKSCFLKFQHFFFGGGGGLWAAVPHLVWSLGGQKSVIVW